jgi:hypothetical protein
MDNVFEITSDDSAKGAIELASEAAVVDEGLLDLIVSR